MVRGAHDRWHMPAVVPTVGRRALLGCQPMTEHHEPIEVIAGEPWEILGTLR